MSGYRNPKKIANGTTMALEEFIAQFDKDHAVALLEGKRGVLEADKGRLTAQGRLLASKTAGMAFRNGNAEGADQLFSDGVASASGKRLQVITPYAGHRRKTNRAYDTISLEDINIAAEPEAVYRSKIHKKLDRLIDQFVSGDKSHYTIKVAYIIRDTVKVFGTKAVKPATVGIFYDDLASPRSGGTGYTMNVCEQSGIPVVDQRVWFNWLTE